MPVLTPSAGHLSRPSLAARRYMFNPEDELAAVDLVGVGERRKLDLALCIGEGDLGHDLGHGGVSVLLPPAVRCT